MATTEWRVVCANGHSAYVEVRDIPPKEVRFADCPKCGAPRRGSQLDSNPI